MNDQLQSAVFIEHSTGWLATEPLGSSPNVGKQNKLLHLKKREWWVDLGRVGKWVWDDAGTGWKRDGLSRILHSQLAACCRLELPQLRQQLPSSSKIKFQRCICPMMTNRWLLTSVQHVQGDRTAFSCTKCSNSKQHTICNCQLGISSKCTVVRTHWRCTRRSNLKIAFWSLTDSHI